jgi:hypothetical protein
MEPYLTTPQACELLGCDRRSLYKLVDDCSIPPRYVYRIGARGELRIHPAAFTPNLDPDHDAPHPQTHSLLALIDRTMANLSRDLEDLTRIRSVIAEGGTPRTPRLLDSPSAFAAD